MAQGKKTIKKDQDNGTKPKGAAKSAKSTSEKKRVTKNKPTKSVANNTKKSAPRTKVIPKSVPKNTPKAKVVEKSTPKKAVKPRVKAKAEPIKVKKEPSKNPEDYPVTPVVAAYREMVQIAIDKRESDLGENPAKEQRLYIESLEQNWKDAPYTLRYSSSTNHEPKYPHLNVSSKVVKKPVKKPTKKKK